MLTWIPVISPIDIQLAPTQPRLPRHEEPIVDVDYEVHDDTPPTSLIERAEREEMVRENTERSTDEWRAKLEAAQRRLKGEE